MTKRRITLIAAAAAIVTLSAASGAAAATIAGRRLPATNANQLTGWKTFSENPSTFTEFATFQVEGKVCTAMRGALQGQPVSGLSCP